MVKKKLNFVNVVCERPLRESWPISTLVIFPLKYTSLLIIRLGGVHKLRLQNLAFFDYLPPSVYIFYGIKVYKKSIFLTTYPPPLVNVVCERPQKVAHLIHN